MTTKAGPGKTIISTPRRTTVPPMSAMTQRRANMYVMVSNRPTMCPPELSSLRSTKELFDQFRHLSRLLVMHHVTRISKHLHGDRTEL